MFPSIWCMPICTGNNSGHSNPLSSSKCYGRPKAGG